MTTGDAVVREVEEAGAEAVACTANVGGPGTAALIVGARMKEEVQALGVAGPGADAAALLGAAVECARHACFHGLILDQEALRGLFAFDCASQQVCSALAFR